MSEESAMRNGHSIPRTVLETVSRRTNRNTATKGEPSKHSPLTSSRSLDVAELLAAARLFAEEVAARPNHGETSAPIADLERMAQLGLFTAPLPQRVGGLGLGTEADGHLPLLRLMAMLGGAELVLGRLYEGHVNALILICSYGTHKQLEKAAADAHDGCLFGVWNTGASEPMRLEFVDQRHVFRGTKTFASGASFVRRPIVTAELPGGGWQMTLPSIDLPPVADLIRVDPAFWHPLGMEASESYSVDFSGASVSDSEFIGGAGDFYREPLFRGGAMRFASVHAGAIVGLHRMFSEWLMAKERFNDPYQIARLGEVAIGAQQAVLWVERAAAVAEYGLSSTATKSSAEQVVECADMMRLATERIATSVMHHVVIGIGAHGLLQPSRFERILRDLTMYLRQPAPDFTLAEVGRSSIRKARLRADRTEHGLWTKYGEEGSLPPAYFREIYDRSIDPWNFQTSPYETEKYDTTIASLPKTRYARALEVGCSIGVLTQKLASQCEYLLGIDVSEKALAAARERCCSQQHVGFARMQVPNEFPDSVFDLIVVSEVAYYWTKSDLELAARTLAKHQNPGDHLVLVHYTVPVPDYPLTGDEVHDLWLAMPEWKSIKQERHERYRLNVLERQETPDDQRRG